MKLVRENFQTFFVLLIFGVVIIEIIFGLVTYFYSKVYIKKTFNEAKDVSREKIKVITEVLNNSTLKMFSKFRSDLILIGKHMSLLDDIISSSNTDSQFYKNYEENDTKQIISSKFENIISNSQLTKYLDNTSYQFKYINAYENEFKSVKNPNSIIDSLFIPSEHNELNLISYYNSIYDVDNIDDNTKIFGKYLISILKSLYIGRYFSKRSSIEYLRFIYFYENECFIYPPDAYNNTQSYIFSEHFLNATFPNSIYSFLNKQTKQSKENPYFYSNITGTNLISCLTISYFNDIGYICLEIDILNLFINYQINNKTKLELLTITNEDLSMIYLDGLNIDIVNLTNIYNNNSFSNYQLKYPQTPQLFHLLYYDLFESFSKEVNIKDILSEYKEIHNLFINKIKEFIKMKESFSFQNNLVTYEDSDFSFFVNKTNCHERMNNYQKDCGKEPFLVLINPLIIYNDIFDKDYLIKNIDKNIESRNIFATIAVLALSEDFTKSKIYEIMNIKLFKISLYLLIMSCGVISVITLFLMLVFRCCYKELDDINTEFEKFIFFTKKDYTPTTINKFNSNASNKEMNELSKIFNSLKINYILKKTIENQETEVEITQNLFQNLNHIKNKDIKNRYIMIIAHTHFEKGFYEKAKYQISSLINQVNEKENNCLVNIEYDEKKIKDTISRTSSSAYLNEYSSFKGINDNMLTIIRIKLMKQKINYLLGMCIYRTLLQNSKNKIYIYNNRKKNEKLLQEAIKYFTICREISNALGVNPIIQIFSLINISRCYMMLSNYKKAISTINDALILYERLTDIFKGDLGGAFNPKVMLFIVNFIFQSIMFTFSQVCYFFNKYYACNWISIKIIETSPFVINNIFFEDCLFSYSSFRTILKRKPFTKNAKPTRIVSIYSKIFSRIYNKFRKYESWNEKLNFYNFSNPFTSNITKSSVRSNFENLKNIITKESKNFFKKERLITICISEKIISNINGIELRDILIKYLQKFFQSNEKDSFSFIQFTLNGKKSIYIKPEKLDLFLKRFETNKDALQLTEKLINNEVLLSVLYNLFHFMIKQQREEPNYNKNEYNNNIFGSSHGNSNTNKNSNGHNENEYKPSSNPNNIDKIILLFMMSDEIRFNSANECVSIVNDLNKSNCMVIIFCYEEDITKDKMYSIYRYIKGIFDGHLVQVTNYQQIKQILMNFAIYNYQEIFANFKYENLDLIL